MSRRRLTTAAQVLGSALVLALLVRDAEPAAVLAALERASLPWVLAAALIKALGVTLHELRIWVSLLPWKRAGLLRVLGVGYTAGLLNGVLPVRGGDLVAVGLLRAECRVSTTQALAAIAITGFGEALVFGVFVLGVMAAGAAQWELLLGPDGAARATSGLTVAVLASVFGSVAVALVGRRLGRGAPSAPRPGPAAWLRQAVVDAGSGLSAWGPLALNVGLAVVQVGLVVLSFWALLPALGLELPLPLLATCGLIAVGSLAGVVLPPGLGASQAATSVFVLAFFGVDEPAALAYAALGWVTNTGPAVALGIVPFWRRVRRAPELLEAARGALLEE
jgi:uncharacterized membrane protein YbhN (UPF0104 family)